METISDFLLLTCSCYFPRTIKSNICLILKLPSNLVGEKGENKTGTNISLNTVVCKILYQIFLTFIIEGHSNIFFISLIFNGPNSKFMQKENYKQSEVFFFHLSSSLMAFFTLRPREVLTMLAFFCFFLLSSFVFFSFFLAFCLGKVKGIHVQYIKTVLNTCPNQVR